MKIPKNEFVQARVDPGTKLRLKKLADKKQVSEAEVVRMGLKKILSNASTNVRNQ